MRTKLIKIHTVKSHLIVQFDMFNGHSSVAISWGYSLVKSFLTYAAWFGMSWCDDYRQDKRMDELNLFIDYHTKCIVTIIWARHVLTPHLSHANWCKPSFPYTGSCKNAPCMLCNFSKIESYHKLFLSCNPLSMDDEETLILLYH